MAGRTDDDVVAWLRPRWVGAALNLVAAVAAVGAYVSSAQAGVADGGRRTSLLLLGALCTALVVAGGAAKQLRDARRLRTAAQIAVDAEEELGTALNGALAPITSYLGEMSDASSRSDRALVAGKIRQAVVDAAVLLTADGARSAFYLVDRHGTRLLREAYAGRSMLPRAEFLAGTTDGDVVLDVVARGDLIFIEDVLDDPMIAPSAPGTYRSVIAVAVTAGSRRIGLLTVDAESVGDLTATDVELVRVLANLLGSGLAQAA